MTIDEIPSHSHTQSVPQLVSDGHAEGSYGYHANGAFNDTASAGGGKGHSHSLNSTNTNTSSVGSAQAIDITPSSVAFYIWKRTA